MRRKGLPRERFSNAGIWKELLKGKLGGAVGLKDAVKGRKPHRNFAHTC